MKERISWILSDELVSSKSLLDLIVTCASIFCEPRRKNIKLGFLKDIIRSSKDDFICYEDYGLERKPRIDFPSVLALLHHPWTKTASFTLPQQR